MGGFRVGIEIPLLSWSLHLLGEAEWAGGGRVSGPRGFRWLGRLSAFILVLKGVRSSGVRSRGGGFSGAVGLFGGRPCFEAFGLRALDLRRNNSVTRSGLRTVSDGEFDWGGTSFKR